MEWCEHLGFSLAVEESVSSTNDALIVKMKEGTAARTLLLAGTQTGGKGRSGNPWQSLPGNLHVSWSEKTDYDVTTASQLVYLVGLAVVDALFDYGIEAQLKWPNDVMVGDQKIAGILLESGMRGTMLDYVVIGLGLNIAASPDDDSIQATSLAELGKNAKMASLLEQIMTAYTRYYDCWQEEGFELIQTEWEEMAYGIGQPITARTRSGDHTGVLEGIDEQGNLRLTTDGGEVLTLPAAEVFFS